MKRYYNFGGGNFLTQLPAYSAVFGQWQRNSRYPKSARLGCTVVPVSDRLPRPKLPNQSGKKGRNRQGRQHCIFHEDLFRFAPCVA